MLPVTEKNFFCEVASVLKLHVWLLFSLTVNITRHPEDQSVTTGTNINFHVEATGYDVLHFQWQKDDQDVDINEPRFSSEETNGASTLHIQRVKSSDEGYYRCIVKNAFEKCGKPSSEAELRVCKSIVFCWWFTVKGLIFRQRWSSQSQPISIQLTHTVSLEKFHYRTYSIIS